MSSTTPCYLLRWTVHSPVKAPACLTPRGVSGCGRWDGDIPNKAPPRCPPVVNRAIMLPHATIRTASLEWKRTHGTKEILQLYQRRL